VFKKDGVGEVGWGFGGKECGGKYLTIQYLVTSYVVDCIVYWFYLRFLCYNLTVLKFIMPGVLIIRFFMNVLWIPLYCFPLALLDTCRILLLEYCLCSFLREPLRFFLNFLLNPLYALLILLVRIRRLEELKRDEYEGN
jgi:hypothetical protein